MTAPASLPEILAAYLSISKINARIAPLSVNEAALRALGFEPAGKMGISTLYRASDFPLICEEIVRHVRQVRNHAA